jgi:photosystem II stability/assembly factor-like uncharacterized protein
MNTSSEKRNISKQIATYAVWAPVLVAATLTLHAQDFKVVGPGGGGAMFHATISPHDPNEVLVGCDMTGSYISHDGGRSWRMFNLRGTARFFAFDPIDRRTMYAGTQALWRSTDDGESWKLIWPRPANIRSVYMSTDHADETIVADDNVMGEVFAFAIDPADSRTLYAGAVNDHKPAVFMSTDSGSTWKKLHDLTSTPMKLWINPYSDKTNRDIYVSGKDGIAVRRHGDWVDHAAPADVVFTDVSAGFAEREGAMIYAVSKAGVYLSHDAGASWSRSTLPGSGAQVRAVATSLLHPESAYVSYSHLQLGGKMWMGVARTRDSGRTWTLAWKEDKTSSPNIHDAWIAKDIGVEWGENPLELGVADQNPELCYGTDFGRTMITTDGGATWNGAYSKQEASGNWISTGLDVTTNYGYLFDPFDHTRRFIPTTDIGLFRSEDSGHSWTRSISGVPESWSNTTYWVAFDPAVRGKMWGVMSGTHDLPRPKMWRTTPTTKYHGGVCVSLDGGRTWKVSNSGMPETAPTHILLDPTSPAGKRTLWVSAMGRGVYKSTDDGATWQLKNNGITQPSPLAWRLSRASDGTLYLVIARRSEDGSIGTPGDGALYKSTDGAESWTAVKLPEQVNGPNGLTVDPQTPGRLYLSAWTRATKSQGIGGGIYLSTDAGQTWRNVFNRDQHIYDVTVDPHDAKVLYAAGFESSAWRSSDRGEHWSRIAGFNFKWGHRVMPDLDDPHMVYINTFGGGVWHGASSGDKRRPDIARPQLEPGQ